MFDVGFWEMSLIGVLALVILGPERLPVVARTLGRWVRRGRRFVSNFGEELTGDSSISDLREEVRRMRGEIEEHARDTMGEVEGMSNDLNKNGASDQDSDEPRSMYEFSLDDVDNAPGGDTERDDAEFAAHDQADADEIARDLNDHAASPTDSSVDDTATTAEQAEPIDSDDEDEALYARARRRYAGVDNTKANAQDTTDAHAASARASTSNSE